MLNFHEKTRAETKSPDAGKLSGGGAPRITELASFSREIGINQVVQADSARSGQIQQKNGVKGIKTCAHKVRSSPSAPAKGGGE